MSEKTLEQEAILGAYTAAGSVMNYDTDEEYREEVVRKGKEIIMDLDENSDLYRKLNLLVECKKFVGTLLVAEVEQRSTRGFIGLATKGGSKFNQEGVDTLRTDRTDASREAQELIEAAQGMIGHRVLVYMTYEETKNGDKVRVLLALKDLGKDTQEDVRVLAEKKQLALAKMK